MHTYPINIAIAYNTAPSNTIHNDMECKITHYTRPTTRPTYDFKTTFKYSARVGSVPTSLCDFCMSD